MLKLWVTIILILAAMQAIGLGIDNQGLAGNLSFKGGNISLASEYPAACCDWDGQETDLSKAVYHAYR